MNAWLTLLATNYLAWLLLGLSLPRHYRQHYGTEPGTRRARALRAAGWVMSAIAYCVSVRRLGWDLGSVAWAGLWMVTAMAWVLLQAWQPRLGRWLAPVLVMLAIGSAMG